MKGDYIGAFEELVLLAVEALGVDAYAANLQRVLEREARRPVSLGAVHTSLDRLENKGLVSSTMGEPVAIRGGRARRYYTVTPLGLDAVRHAQAAVQTLSAGLDTLLVNGLAGARKGNSSRF